MESTVVDISIPPSFKPVSLSNSRICCILKTLKQVHFFFNVYTYISNIFLHFYTHTLFSYIIINFFFNFTVLFKYLCKKTENWFKGSKLHIFGSSGNRYGTKSSDIDVCLEVTDAWSSNKKNPQKTAVFKLTEKLKREKDGK